MTGLADVFAELDDPRAVNARLHSRHDILPVHRHMRRGQRRPDPHRYGTFRPRQKVQDRHTIVRA